MKWEPISALFLEAIQNRLVSDPPPATHALLDLAEGSDKADPGAGIFRSAQTAVRNLRRKQISGILRLGEAIGSRSRGRRRDGFEVFGEGRSGEKMHRVEIVIEEKGRYL